MKKIIYILNTIFLAGIISFSANQTAAQKKPVKRRLPIQRLTVYVRDEGYEPSNINLKRGVPARLTIIRQSEYECGEEIVFPAYNIRRKLPLNRPVVVNFTPKQSGSLDFTCGMQMMRGKLIVN